MAYLIAVILGDLLIRIDFFKALRAALLLGSLSFVAYRLASANGGPHVALALAVVVPATIFVWAALNPTQSERRFEIYEGVYLILRVMMWFLIVALFAGFVSVGFHLKIWVQRDASWAAVTAVIWGLQRLMDLQLERSHRMMGEQSVLWEGGE